MHSPAFCPRNLINSDHSFHSQTLLPNMKLLTLSLSLSALITCSSVQGKPTWNWVEITSDIRYQLTETCVSECVCVCVWSQCVVCVCVCSVQQVAAAVRSGVPAGADRHSRTRWVVDSLTVSQYEPWRLRARLLSHLREKVTTHTTLRYDTIRYIRSFTVFTHNMIPWKVQPHAGSGVVRIDPLRFLAGCRTRRLNQV